VAEYAITFARSARRELEALDTPAVDRIFGRIEDLARDPRPRGCRKLCGRQGLWCLRVGDYRVLYAINDEERVVDVVAVRHRRDAYR